MNIDTSCKEKALQESMEILGKRTISRIALSQKLVSRGIYDSHGNAGNFLRKLENSEKFPVKASTDGTLFREDVKEVEK